MVLHGFTWFCYTLLLFSLRTWPAEVMFRDQKSQFSDEESHYMEMSQSVGVLQVGSQNGAMPNGR